MRPLIEPTASHKICPGPIVARWVRDVWPRDTWQDVSAPLCDDPDELNVPPGIEDKDKDKDPLVLYVTDRRAQEFGSVPATEDHGNQINRVDLFAGPEATLVPCPGDEGVLPRGFASRLALRGSVTGRPLRSPADDEQAATASPSHRSRISACRGKLDHARADAADRKTNLVGATVPCPRALSGSYPSSAELGPSTAREGAPPSRRIHDHPRRGELHGEVQRHETRRYPRHIEELRLAGLWFLGSRWSPQQLDGVDSQRVGQLGDRVQRR